MHYPQVNLLNQTAKVRYVNSKYVSYIHFCKHRVKVYRCNEYNIVWIPLFYQLVVLISSYFFSNNFFNIELTITRFIVYRLVLSLYRDIKWIREHPKTTMIRNVYAWKCSRSFFMNNSMKITGIRDSILFYLHLVAQIS